MYIQIQQTRQHHTSITTRETCDLGEDEHVADERVMHAWSKHSVGLVGCWSGVRVGVLPFTRDTMVTGLSRFQSPTRPSDCQACRARLLSSCSSKLLLVLGLRVFSLKLIGLSY
jgi:hypothetical protein